MAGLLWKVDLEFQPRCSWLLRSLILTRLPAFTKERSEHTKEEQLLVAQWHKTRHCATLWLTCFLPSKFCWLFRNRHSGVSYSVWAVARQLLINHSFFLPPKQGNLRKGILFLLCSEFEKRNGTHQYWSYEYDFVFSSAFDHDCSEAILTSTQPCFRP